jgi:hypothetical protein
MIATPATRANAAADLRCYVGSIAGQHERRQDSWVRCRCMGASGLLPTRTSPATLLAGRGSHLRAVRVREHDFRWSPNAVVLRRRRLTAAAAALLQLAGAHLIEQPGVERLS